MYMLLLASVELPEWFNYPGLELWKFLNLAIFVAAMIYICVTRSAKPCWRDATQSNRNWSTKLNAGSRVGRRWLKLIRCWAASMRTFSRSTNTRDRKQNPSASD